MMVDGVVWTTYVMPMVSSKNKNYMCINMQYSSVFTNATWRNHQRYTYRVLQAIQMKLILLSVWAERAILGSAKTALKFKYEI